MDTANCFDIYVTNVPGPKKELYFNGIKATNLVVVPPANSLNFFLAIFTYNGKFQLTLTADSGIYVCPRKFIDLMEKEIVNIIEQFEK